MGPGLLAQACLLLGFCAKVSAGCTGRVALGINGLLKVGGLLVLSGLVRVEVGPQMGPDSQAESFRVALDGCQAAFASGKPEKCKLFGKIQFVDSFPDVKVQVVDSFPDVGYAFLFLRCWFGMRIH